MDAIAIIATIGRQIQRSCAQGVCWSAGLALFPFCKFGLAVNHFRRWGPCRPRLAVGNIRFARPFETGFSNSDAIANGLALTQNEVEVLDRWVDDDRARSFGRFKFHDLTFEFVRDFFGGNGRDGKAVVAGRKVDALCLGGGGKCCISTG